MLGNLMCRAILLFWKTVGQLYCATDLLYTVIVYGSLAKESNYAVFKMLSIHKKSASHLEQQILSFKSRLAA